MTTDHELFAAYRISPLPSTLPGRLLNFATRLWYIGLIVRGDLQSRVPLSLTQRIRGWRHGFSTLSYLTYRLDVNDPGDYLSDYASTKTFVINEPFTALYRNKLLFSIAMRRLGLAHARPRALIHRGRISLLDGATVVESYERWLDRLSAGGTPVVLKPLLGGGGSGIAFLEPADDHGFAVNGVGATRTDVLALLSRLDDYLAAELVAQSEYAARIYPRTTNTIRVLTLWDHASAEPFIAAAAHRFGNARSFPVDNWHRGQGGLSVKIDLVSGELGPAATIVSNQLRWFDQHPESGARITGIRVPNWDDTRREILRAAASLPYTPAVGWDLVMTDGGGCFLEGNSPPFPSVWQVHDPLLSDKRVRQFYEAYGVG